MIISTSKHASHSAHQTVTEEFIELSTGVESIRIGFTEQKISGRAGLSTFCGFLGWHRLLGNLPAHIRLRVVRADSGFCVAPWLELLESQRLKYIVVARLLKPLQRLCRKETIWTPSEVPGTEVAQVWHEEMGWGQARRLMLDPTQGERKEAPRGQESTPF